MAIDLIQVTHDRAGDLHWPGTSTKQTLMNAVINLLAGLVSGMFAGGTSGAVRVLKNAVKAVGTLTISSGSGDLITTIGGTAVTTTWATSDAATATAHAADINADATASLYVVAAKGTGATVVLTAVLAGLQGNAMGLTVSGTGLTADGSGFMGGTTAGTNGTLVTKNI